MLARGELRAVGATTLDEYRKHIEKDAALERRFQPVMVGEPTVEDTIAILRGLKEPLRGAPRRAYPGQRSDRRRDALGALHRRPLPARQGDRPDRRGGLRDPDRDRLGPGRDRRDRPSRDAARDRADLAGEGDRRGLGRTARGARARAGRAEGALGGDEGPVAEREAGDQRRLGSQGAARAGARGRRARAARRRLERAVAAALPGDPGARRAARRAGAARFRAARGHHGLVPQGGGRRRRRRRGRRPLDRHPRQPAARGRNREADPHGGPAARTRDRPGRGGRGRRDRAAALARGPAGPRPADRHVPVPRPDRCRQDRAGARAGGVHVRLPGGDDPDRHVRVHGETLRVAARRCAPRATSATKRAAS